MDFRQFKEVINILENFYERIPPKKQLDAWYSKICHLNFEVAKQACDEITSHLKDFPTPAKFLEFADNAEKRISYISNIKDKNEAASFFHDEDMGPPGLAKDCTSFINILLSEPSFKKWEKQYEEGKKLMSKYPAIDVRWAMNQAKEKMQIELERQYNEKQNERI